MYHLLATFYIQSPEFLFGEVACTARVLYPSGANWYENTSELCTSVTAAHYNDPANGNQKRYRYKVDLFRTEQETYDSNDGGRYVKYYPLHKAGVYKRKLEIKVNNSFILERMIFITIQPDVHVYLQEGDKQIDLVHTEQTLITQNLLTLKKTVLVEKTPEAVRAKNIALTESNQYNQKVFIESNLPIDLYGTTLSSETSSSENSTWLRLQEKICLTRRIRNSEYQWHDGYGSSPIIQTDALGMYVRFISSESNGYETSLLDHPYYGAVELGLEKPFLDLPICVEADVRLYLCEIDKYTGTNESTEKTAAVEFPLHVSLKTLHAVKISPPLITLDEDNNYTSFLALEANDGAAWSFEPDERISVTPMSGTGRAAVIVRKADSFELVSNFERVVLAVTSTVDAAKFPDIDGKYKVTTSAEIHIEKYQPEHNALIPRMVSNSCDGITIASYQKDTANELNGDFATNAHHASYAITSADDVLHIDTGDSVVLDKMELTGTNIRRTIEAGVAKGGAAISFSLFGSNDLSDVWTLLRNGDTATDIAALSGTTTAGQWQQSNVNVTLTNTGNFSYRYYKLVPINRSSDQEISLALHRINLYKKVAAVQIDTAEAVVTDNFQTASGTLQTLVSTSSQTANFYAVDANHKTYRLQVDFGAANLKKIDLIQITGWSSSNNDALVLGLIIEASEDENTWIVLLTTDEPLGTSACPTRSFDIFSEKSYRYYRITIPSQPNTVSFYLNKVRFFTKTGRTLVSCLLPKSPHLNSVGTWTCPVTITSAAVCDLPSAVSNSFDHSLSNHGCAGRFTTGFYYDRNSLASHTGSLSPHALKNLDQFPTVEIVFEKPHRIRSWSLQSVGMNVSDSVFEALATVLVLQGQTLDGAWHVLDIVRSQEILDYQTGNSVSEFFSLAKYRIDRTIPSPELFCKIRISAVAVKSQTLALIGFVWFPQIQVFAGVPVIPKLQTSYDGSGSQNSTVQVRSNGGTENDEYYGTQRDAGMRVFDREVGGNTIARIGSRAWYINNNHFLLEDVAENGNLSQFGSYQSKAWLALIFPAARILGYLYSIDNLQSRSDPHANTSYAASLYFEGRKVADDAATLEPSAQWEFLDIVSLDRCIGHHEFGMLSETLIAETDQQTLQVYAEKVGLPVLDRTFLMNRFDRHIIRYQAESKTWYDDGLRLEPGTVAATANQFGNMTTDELLNQAGQSRLNSVAQSRGTAMQPPWSKIPHKASIVNQKDNRRMMYNQETDTWSEVPNNDAIDLVHDRTHYADLKNASNSPMLLAQLRCTAQSIMNTEKPSVGGEPVAMPEMQLFGLPAGSINTGTVATITFLKAEDSFGTLHDVLGKYQMLPFYRWYSSYYSSYTEFRLYLGTIQHIKPDDKKIYLDIHTESSIVQSNVSVEDNYSDTPYRTISVSGDHRSVRYYELFIYSANNERIVLSSGFTGDGK